MSSDPHWLLMKEIVDAATALSGEQRSRYLDQRCPDEAMRAEAERLIGPPPKRDASGLSPGALLGHYRIQNKLGQGGMGWVYEATDEKLHRTVAIKVLPPGVIDEDQRKRFTREAQSASALNHPNIVTVHEVGRQGDIDFIVMERVMGETLREEIVVKGLDPRTALRYAVQIADALAAAHDAGIVHRDLKPSNVMVTERGLVKVLDFGIAKHTVKLFKPAALDGPTADDTLTGLGQVVGTVSYMSPEQAQGKPVDPRSDIFSFGSVLFEMLTGQVAFHDSHIGTRAAVVLNEPSFAPLPPSLPRSVSRVLAKCLEKKPADRWQHISDVRFLLEDLLKEMESPSGATPDSIPAGPLQRRFGWPVVVAACLGGALAAAGIFQLVRGSAPPAASEPILRMVTADNGLSSFPALSRDGKLLAFASDRGNQGNLDIWLQQIGGRDPIRLTKDPADETDPTFSPDGALVAYRSEVGGGGIYMVPAIGAGEPVLLAPGGRNPRFSPDGQWIAYWTGREGSFVAGAARLFLVEAGGGQPRPVHPEMAAAMYPAWSPRGDALIVLGRQGGANLATLDWWILPLDKDKGSPKAVGALRQLRAQGLLRTQLGLGVLPTVFDWTGGEADRILFAAALGDSANLWEFQLSTQGQVRGPARRVIQAPGRQVHAARALLDDAERTAFSDEALNFDIWTIPVDADTGVTRGEPQRLTTEASPEWAPSISWDGRKLAYITRHAGVWSLRSRDLASGADQALIFSPGLLVAAKYSGDGNRVMYSNEEYSLYAVPGRSGAAERFCERCGTVTGASADGSRVTYEPLENEDLTIFDVAARKSGKLALRPGRDTILSGGQFSRDGQWVAFHSLSNLRTTAQIWIAPVQETAVSQSDWIPVTDGNALERDPCWAPAGGVIYFVSERDGFGCVWARRLDPATKRPSGSPFAVRHFHSSRQSLRRVGAASRLTGLSVGGNRMVFALSDLTGNIWLSETPRAR